MVGAAGLSGKGSVSERQRGKRDRAPGALAQEGEAPHGRGGETPIS